MPEDNFKRDEIYRKRIRSLIIMAAGPIIGFLPLVIGMIGSAFIPNCNESNCSWATVPWFCFLTLPAGFVIFVVGFILWANSKNQQTQ